jgi:hypothetical protein
VKTTAADYQEAGSTGAGAQMSTHAKLEPADLHQLRNYLAVIQSFSELVLLEMPDDDTRRGDMVEIQNAVKASLELLPGIALRLN